MLHSFLAASATARKFAPGVLLSASLAFVGYLYLLDRIGFVDVTATTAQGYAVTLAVLTGALAASVIGWTMRRVLGASPL